MIFKPGLYRHKNGWIVNVLENGQALLSPDAPLSARLSDLFDRENWEPVKDVPRETAEVN